MSTVTSKAEPLTTRTSLPWACGSSWSRPRSTPLADWLWLSLHEVRHGLVLGLQQSLELLGVVTFNCEPAALVREDGA